VSPRPRLVLAVVAGLGAMLLYAGQFVFSRWGIQRTLSPWDLAALRFGAAGLLLLPVAIRHGVSGGTGVGWARALALTTTAGGPYTLIMFAGLSLAPAGHGAVIIPGATPVVSTLLVWLWFGERPGPARLAGLVLVVAGLLLVGWPGLTGAAGGRTWLGDALFVVAGVLWGLFTVLTRRWQVDPLRAATMVWIPALAYLPLYALVAGARLATAPRGEVVFQVFYQGVGVALVALALYAWSIRVLGASVASFFMPLIPLLGMLLAVPMLGEVPAGIQLVGVVAVSGGMALAAYRGPS
jgi:drug/metabolite transporter (DMT)-like permease